MIITNKFVDKDFDGVDCLLRRTILKVEKLGNKRYYHILTERCNFVDVPVEAVYETTIGEDGNLIKSLVSEATTKKALNIIGKKDEIQIKPIGKSEYNGIYDIIKLNTSLEDDLWGFEHELEKNALLVMTKLSHIFHTEANDWVYYPEYEDELNEPSE